MPKLSPIAEKILQERGLTKVKRHKTGKKRDSFGKFAPKPQLSVRKKTPLMRYLEQKYHVAIEEVLVSGSLSIVAKQLGNEVDVSTISKWIKKLRLKYTKDNLPDCQDCKHRGLACEGGVCLILMSLELWELVLIKKEEMLNGN